MKKTKIKKTDISAENVETYLQEAITNGDTKTVKMLLDTEKYFNTPLLLAIEVEKESVVDLLLQKNAHVEIMTPLGLAINKNNPAVVKKLLQKGANPMKQVTLGQEKFYPIQLSQNAKINELLIQWKADTGMGPKSRSQQNLSIKKDDSKTELVQVKSSNNLAYASDSRSTTASSSRLLRKTVKSILDKDVQTLAECIRTSNFDFETPIDDTPLAQAISDGNVEIVQVLLEGNASIKPSVNYGKLQSVLDLSKSNEMSLLLLHYGVDPLSSVNNSPILSLAKDQVNQGLGGIVTFIEQYSIFLSTLMDGFITSVCEILCLNYKQIIRYTVPPNVIKNFSVFNDILRNKHEKHQNIFLDNSWNQNPEKLKVYKCYAEYGKKWIWNKSRPVTSYIVPAIKVLSKEQASVVCNYGLSGILPTSNHPCGNGYSFNCGISDRGDGSTTLVLLSLISPGSIYPMSAADNLTGTGQTSLGYQSNFHIELSVPITNPTAFMKAITFVLYQESQALPICLIEAHT